MSSLCGGVVAQDDDVEPNPNIFPILK